MNTTAVQKFYEALKADRTLAEELKGRSDELNREAARKAFEMMAEFARSKGYDITVDDLKVYETDTQELSADELDQVSAATSVCLVIGFGWGDTDRNRCRVIGGGLIG